MELSEIHSKIDAISASANKLAKLERQAGEAEMLSRIQNYASEKRRGGVFRASYVSSSDLLDFVGAELERLKREAK